MPQIDPPTFSEAEAIVNDPNATPEQLNLIAQHHPSLDALVAVHPRAYPELLDWLAQYGDDATKQVVAQRRAADGSAPATNLPPVAPPSPAPVRRPLAQEWTSQPPPPGVNYPPTAAPIPLDKPAARSKPPTGLLIGGIVAVVVIALAVVLVATPVLSGLRGGQPAATPDAGRSTSANPSGSAQPGTSGMPTCPAGSIQLAFATFPDGWVLICGVDATTPTRWYSQDAQSSLESTSVSYDATNYRYLVNFSDGGTGWLNHTPGVFGHADPNGTILAQRSVGQIWFVALDGSSGGASAAPSTGPFGVPLPQESAQDQVRYLSALLQKSASARKALQPAVIAVRDCENGSYGDYTAAVSTISSVTDNRTQLLSALETAPVDKVPDGTALVSELRLALSYSLRADKAYLAWATAVNNSGCGAGSEAEGTQNSKRAGPAKETFVKHWNSRIAGSFNAPTFTRDQL